MDADQAGAGDTGDQEEMFDRGSLDGDGIDLARLIRPGLPVEYTKSLLKGEVPGRNKLTNPEGERRAIVTHELAEVVVVIKREDGEIVGYKIREKLRPTYVEAESE
jgi:hypothetical protein